MQKRFSSTTRPAHLLYPTTPFDCIFSAQHRTACTEIIRSPLKLNRVDNSTKRNTKSFFPYRNYVFLLHNIATATTTTTNP